MPEATQRGDIQRLARNLGLLKPLRSGTAPALASVFALLLLAGPVNVAMEEAASSVRAQFANAFTPGVVGNTARPDSPRYVP